MAVPKCFLIIDSLELKKLNSLKKHLLSHVGAVTEVYSLIEIAAATKSYREQYNSIEIIQQCYFPNSTIKLVANNFSVLFLIIEEWIALEQMTLEPYTKELLTQKWYNNHGFYNLADQTIRKIHKKIQTNPMIGLMESKAISDSLYEHIFSSNPIKYDLKATDFDDMIDAFSEYTAIQNLVYLIELVNRAEVANLNITIRKKLLINKLKDAPNTNLLRILFLVYDMIDKDDISAFNELKELLLSNFLDQNSKIHTIVTTYVIKRSMRYWNKGLLKDPKIISELAVYGLNHGIYLNNGKLPTATFHNLVSQLCQSSTYKEMQVFVRKWVPMVHTNNHEATQSLALAQVAFYFEKYGEIAPLVRINFNDFNEKNLGQLLYLISSFMERRKENELYQHALQSSKYFLRRNQNKFSKHLFTSVTNLFEFMKQMDQPNYEIDLDALSPLFYRKWCQSLLSK